MSNNCSDTKKLSRRVMACGPPCCEPIYCFVDTKACHASQHKNGFRQNTHDEDGRPLVKMKPGVWGQMVFAEPLKYYLRSTKNVSWNESCRSGVSWGCFRGLGIFICRYGVSNDSSSQMGVTHTLEKFDGGRAGCESGTLGGSASARSNGKEGNVTGGGSVYGWPCGYKSFRGGRSSNSQTSWIWSSKTTDNGPAAIVSSQSQSELNEPETGCYEPYASESLLGEINALYNESVQEETYGRSCSGNVEVVSWRFCPGPDWPDLKECFGINYKVVGLTCREWGVQERSIAPLAGYGHFNFGGPSNEWVKPGTKPSITPNSYSHQLSSCADSIASAGKNESTGEGNNNRQGPWSPNEIPDGDGSSTSGYGGTGENGGGQASEGQSSQPIWTNNPFPPLQGAQNSPASTQSAYQQTPPTRPLPPVSQHPPSLHDAYINGVRPTYPIHGGSSPTGGGNAPSWTGVWGSTVDGTTWWYQQGTTASGSSYAEGSYYISPGNWGYQFTQW